MILIKPIKDRDYLSIEFSGHAGYAPIGQDIICSAVSSLYYSLCAVLTEKEIEFSLSEDGDKKLIFCKNMIAEPYFDMVIIGCFNISQTFPDYCKVQSFNEFSSHDTSHEK